MAKCSLCGKDFGGPYLRFVDKAYHLSCLVHTVEIQQVEIDRLQVIVHKVPAKRILDACMRIEAADNQYMNADGPVAPTQAAMSAEDNQMCYTALWKSKQAPETKEEE